MRKWEYAVFEPKLVIWQKESDKAEAWLNDLGAEGWEFVSILSGMCVFKRQLPIDNDEQ